VFTAKGGHRFLRVDFRDQGFSSPYPQEYDLSIHVDDLKELFDHLELQKVHLVGVSYGAMVALLFALKYPEYLATLILGNAVAR